MKIVIVEDEKHNALRLKEMLTNIDSTIEVLAVLSSVTESISWFTEHQEPDLILMDVRLSDGLSFEIFASCNINSFVIFTTAYDEYAIRAFKVNSLDYLLKPINKAELQSALEKYDQVRSARNQEPGIEDLLKMLKDPERSYRARFLIQKGDRYVSVKVETVEFIYSEFRNTHLVLNDGSTHIVNLTMDEVEEQLDPNLFFRASRQHLVSVNSIKEIQNHFNGKLKLVLSKFPETEVYISKDKSLLFKRWIDR